MNKHYVCTGGCNGVSTDNGTCEATVCLKKGLPLTECDCSDGMHEGLITPCSACGELCKQTGACPKKQD